MQITYNSGNPADQWRCQLFGIRSRPSQWAVMLAAPLFSGFVFAGRMIATNWLGFVAIEALAVLGWTVFLGALLAALIALRTRGRDRICTTTLTPEGFQDVSPDSQAFPSAPSSPGDWSV